MRPCATIAAVAALTACVLWPRTGSTQADPPDIDLFFAAASLDPEVSGPARQQIAAVWHDGYAAMIVDLIDLLRRTGFVDPRGFVQLALLSDFLAQQTGQDFGTDIDAWRRWIWSLPYDPHPDYGEFKGLLYASLDPEFARFFSAPVESSIRLDEIQWGGVAINGIPPLDHPAVVMADAATYLADTDIVFGVANAGEARAYPKRILAWHELALDRVGEQELTVVYCTLCGTVIPFRSEVGGEHRVFGTSGLLYQSNKLMFDARTDSLWSSLTGEPVVGPLVGSGLVLTTLPIVTTTWGAWRQRHPETSVLSIETGFTRDYSEGAAYRAYFGTDALMFDVSVHDGRLANKAEVLVLRALGPATAESPLSVSPPTAIAADYLAARPIFHLTLNQTDLVVVTSAAGANRAYRVDGTRFERIEADRRVFDAAGRSWLVAEAALLPEFDDGPSFPRVAAHRAFWFGWIAQHPDTVLID